MPYLKPEDFDTHIYKETVQQISRENGDSEQGNLLQQAIDGAIDEAASYMARFDIDKILGYGDGEAYVPPVVKDTNLKIKVKDMALYHFMKLNSANMLIEKVDADYKMAIRWFEKLATAGNAMQPRNWPYKDVSTDEPVPEGNSVIAQVEDVRTTGY